VEASCSSGVTASACAARRKILARKAAESRLSRVQNSVWSKRTAIKGLFESARSWWFTGMRKTR